LFVWKNQVHDRSSNLAIPWMGIYGFAVWVFQRWLSITMQSVGDYKGALKGA
jgi:hypothetical protein